MENSEFDSISSTTSGATVLLRDKHSGQLAAIYTMRSTSLIGQEINIENQIKMQISDQIKIENESTMNNSSWFALSSCTAARLLK